MTFTCRYLLKETSLNVFLVILANEVANRTAEEVSGYPLGTLTATEDKSSAWLCGITYLLN